MRLPTKGDTITPFLIGLALSLLTFLFAKAVGFDRDGAFYPVVLVFTALYYVLFAVMGGSRPAFISELIGAMVFTIAAVAGFRSTPWIVVVAFVAHGLFDVVHASLVTDPGVPVFWPAFCLGVDVGLAALIAMRLSKRPLARV